MTDVGDRLCYWHFWHIDDRFFKKKSSTWDKKLKQLVAESQI